MAMMEEVEDGNVEAIIIKDMSRMGRDYKVVVQLARQDKVVEQKRVRFFQTRLVHPPPFSDGTIIVLRQFE